MENENECNWRSLIDKRYLMLLIDTNCTIFTLQTENKYCTNAGQLNYIDAA